MNNDPDEIACLTAYLAAVGELTRQYDPALVVKVARDWLEYMRLRDLILNREAWSVEL